MNVSLILHHCLRKKIIHLDPKNILLRLMCHNYTEDDDDGDDGYDNDEYYCHH